MKFQVKRPVVFVILPIFLMTLTVIAISADSTMVIRKTEQSSVSLKTSVFRYATNMMGPVGLFGARFQPCYEFKIEKNGLRFPSVFSQNKPNTQVSEADLDKILKNTREYCRKLNGAALNFVCLEEVSEKTFQIVRPFQWRGARGFRGRKIEVRHKYLYDYQYIRKDGRLTEKRILLEEDGRKKWDKQTSLLTTMFQYKNVIFGPVNLLDEDRQFFFNYKIVGSQDINGVKTIVLEATPKPWASQNISGGKIWISEGDFSILKIEWNQEKMKRLKIIIDMAERYKGTPVIKQTIEFEFEKNGIRFPSRFFIEEAYINKKGKKTIHSETNVFYKDYKYFTVETKVKYDF